VTRPQPNTRDAYRHFITITTRWMDNDVYRHVNNVQYYSFFDTAVNQYMMTQGVLDLSDSCAVCLTVDSACQYFSEISFPDVVYCGLRVGHLGRSSVRFEIGIFRNDDQVAAAQGHFVHVACDRVTHRPIEMPADMRHALDRLRATDAK
jgi:acyl-CoA thioester hydrolase